MALLKPLFSEYFVAQFSLQYTEGESHLGIRWYRGIHDPLISGCKMQAGLLRGSSAFSSKCLCVRTAFNFSNTLEKELLWISLALAVITYWRGKLCK